jgi:uncharacterized protein (DUF433 family)
MSNLPNPLVLVSPEYLGGTPVFNGTRVPIKNMFDYLDYGHPLDEFLEHFPGVTREHAGAVLHLARDLVNEDGVARAATKAA